MSQPTLALRSRVIRVVLAWPVIAFGIAMLLQANLGVAPFDVLNTGVSNFLDLPFTAVYLVVSVAFFALGALLGGRIGWASVAGSFAIGPMVGQLVHVVPEPDLIVARVGFLIAATLLLAAAVSIVITTELGPGPTEVFMLGLVKRRVPIVGARWIADGLPLLIGVALGGEVGIGTIVFTFALGPLIKLGLGWLHFEPEQDLAPPLVTAIE